ncbi:YbaB/EbfC family nucleoid-associated protein [Actinoplanes sp. TRM 88003]|uniref:YbaB/EbfC family nucleoid-associated protein n=1 Tax=Paractinoplanes aksuensis TaxID=2939490 RepID=A0ABT1DQ09_9ACTN|nr:YbaB/EbfC family nucleoid-associated protein [Actinoplanes aksuensis]MCO8272915.1 YbaB/EbfC family nucleoid-associated protein [Actinoplanes aksuensis]
MPGGNLEDRLAALSATATDEDGVVTVTVGGSGVVTGLRLDDRVQQLAGATLSAEILRTMRRAQDALAEQVAVAVSETVGGENEYGDLDEPPAPVMPSAPPFPSFENTPTLPQQSPGNGYESGRDSRAR